MSTSPEIIQSCSSCGANIYPEHFQRGLAFRESGLIYCRHCMEERGNPVVAPVCDRQDAGPTTATTAANIASLGIEEQAAAPAAAVVAAPPAAVPADRLSGSSLHGSSLHGQRSMEAMYKKPSYKPADTVTRIRTFH